MKRLLKREKGEMMVEASLVLTVVIVVIVSLAYLGLIMYHQTLITSTANQTASNIAQVYSNSSKDPVTGYIDVSNLDNDGMVNKMKNQAYADVIKEKAEWYSKYRLAKGNFLKSEEPEIDVKIENKNGALLRAQVVVTVEEDYELPFVQLLGMEKPTIKYKATGRADCYEILDYVNVVEAVDKIDVTENFKVNFYNKDNSLFKTVEVMHDMSIADTMKLSNAEQTKFPADPTLNGQKFYRWKTETGETFDENTVVSGDMNVYAEYDCIVNFMNYDGNAALYQIFAHRNQPFSNSGNSLPAAPPEEGDNKFYCWWYNNAEFTVNTKIPDSDSITVNIRKYLWVKYDGNGGSVSPNRVFVAPGNAIGNMPIPSHSKYSFLGWYNDRNGGAQYNSGTRIYDNANLYAHWCTHPTTKNRVINDNCTKYEYEKYCTVCNRILKHEIEKREHVFNGRCGTQHTFRNPTHLNSNSDHGRDKKLLTTVGYHIICSKCGAYSFSDRGFYRAYCVKHKKNGIESYDYGWVSLSKQVPGFTCKRGSPY